VQIGIAKLIKYETLADIYDNFVQVNFDIPFFLGAAKECQDEVLELMSGTGRVSIPLAEAGIKLTCVDMSIDMLSILRKKIESRHLSIDIHQGDVCELDLGRQFKLVLLPFNSFSEILTAEGQLAALKRIFLHMQPGGTFICTLHNPVVRKKSVDGQLHLWGNYPLPEKNGTLLFWVTQDFDDTGHIVNGIEFFEEYDLSGTLLSKRLVEFSFSLISKEEFEEMAQSAGFKIKMLYGNYCCEEFNKDNSPYLIWVLQK
jgi:SAM-dependent methyltransferase